MFHLAGYYSSVDPAGALTKIAAISDQAIRTSGNDIVVPSDLNSLIFEAALSAATGPTYAQVESPSLRETANQDVQPVVGAVVFGQNPPCQPHIYHPRKLKAAESVNFSIEATGGVAADNYGLIMLSNGPLLPDTREMFTVRATATAALAVGQWVNSALTFDSTLPSGTYSVVGMRATGTNLVAARLVFVGEGYRPGVPAVNTDAARDFDLGRYGKMGEFGVFEVNQPPTVDCLGVTDTSQEILLDLVKTS